MWRRGCAVLVLASVLALASCAAEPSFPEFDRTQTDEDLPAAVAGIAEKDLDLASVRHVGVADDYDLYLAHRKAPDRTICLIVMDDGAWESTGCGDTGVGITTRSGLRIEVAQPGPLDVDVENQLSESVRIVK